MQDKDALKRSPQRWLRQAEADLRAARNSARSDDYASACFHAQQSAEKALKSLLYLEGRTPIKGRKGHSVAGLITESVKFASDLEILKDKAKFLEPFYESARYPDALESDLTPAEHFDQRAFQADAFSNAFQTKAVDAERSLSYAESILAAVKTYWESHQGTSARHPSDPS